MSANSKLIAIVLTLRRNGTRSVPGYVPTETVGTMRCRTEVRPTLLVKCFASAAIAFSLFSGAAYAGPEIQHWQSAGGAKVLFVENHDIPMLDVSVGIPAGSSFDAADKAGVAGLTHHPPDFGSEGMSVDDIARG